MTSWYKFYLLGAVGGPNATVDDLYYNWGVIHPTMMLATKAAVENFKRYAQNYANPDVPDEARLIPAHSTTAFRTFADHWSLSWDNVVQSITDPSHRERLGRHHFSDISTMQCFFGRGGTVYQTPDFEHPAALTIVHCLGLPTNTSRADAIAQLGPHKDLVVSRLRKFAKTVKYTVDVCDEELVDKIKLSPLGVFPWQKYFAIELLQFTSKNDGFDFTAAFKSDLRSSYARLINPESSHSLYATERVIFNFTDEDPNTQTPLPVYFTDKNSCEYKVQHEDWRSFVPSFDLLDNTEWSRFKTNKDRDVGTFTKALDPSHEWKA